MVRSDGGDKLLRLSAALVATLPVSLYASLALAAFLPVSVEARAAWGFFAPVPLYALLACVVARLRSGTRAWGICVAAAALLKLSLVLLCG